MDEKSWKKDWADFVFSYLCLTFLQHLGSTCIFDPLRFFGSSSPCSDRIVAKKVRHEQAENKASQKRFLQTRFECISQTFQGVENFWDGFFLGLSMFDLFAIAQIRQVLIAYRPAQDLANCRGSSARVCERAGAVESVDEN